LIPIANERRWKLKTSPALVLLRCSRSNHQQKGEKYGTVHSVTLDVFTKDTYAVSSWSAIGAGLLFCLWEGPSEQGIIDVIAKVSGGPPTEGIYPVSVIDWAEMKKAMGG
jgi:hypothetical protein